MLSVASRMCHVFVWCVIGIVNPHIKACHLLPLAPHSVGWQVKLTPSCELAKAPDSAWIWGYTLYNSGSLYTSLHTFVSKLAVGPCKISLCVIEGNPPLAHESACSTVKLLPPSHFLMAVWMVTSHITGPMHHERLTYVEKRTVSHVQAPISFPLSMTLCSCGFIEIVQFLNAHLLILPADDGFILFCICSAIIS